MKAKNFEDAWQKASDLFQGEYKFDGLSTVAHDGRVTYRSTSPERPDDYISELFTDMFTSVDADGGLEVCVDGKSTIIWIDRPRIRISDFLYDAIIRLLCKEIREAPDAIQERKYRSLKQRFEKETEDIR